jgi:alkylation response protein AidB-like acyl-CoA dehydrogenase
MNVVETQSELFDSLSAMVPELMQEAADNDSAAAFPEAGVKRLQGTGLLMAPVPVEFGGFGLHTNADSQALFRLLHLLGYADLSLCCVAKRPGGQRPRGQDRARAGLHRDARTLAV